MRAGSIASVALAAALAANGACKRDERAPPPPDLEPPESWVAACLAGAVGSCTDAARALLARSRGDDDDAKRARQMGERACDGGSADGCLLLVKMIEEPFWPPKREADAGPPPAPRVMGGADASKREAALERACEKGKGCAGLGVALLGVDDDRARAAIEKGCAGGAASDACWRAEAALADAATHGAACRLGVTFACARLADLVRVHDPPRGARMLRAECVARDVADVDACVERRTSEVPRRHGGAFFRAGWGGRARPKSEVDATLAKLTVRVAHVEGIAEPAGAAWVAGLDGGVRTCLEAALRWYHPLPMRLELEIVVDRAGYPVVVRQRLRAESRDSELEPCLLATVDEVHVDAPPKTSFTVIVDVDRGRAPR